MRIKRNAGQLVVYMAVSMLFLITLMPFLLMLISSLKYQMQLIKSPWTLEFPLHFDNYSNAFRQIYGSIGHSLIVAALGVLIALIASSTAAYAFARFKFPGRNLLYTYIIMILMVPGFVILIPQFVQIKDMGMYNTYWGQALPPAANYTAMGVLLIRTFFEGLPGSLLEAAEMEGAKETTIFGKIVLPLSRPILATVSIITGLTIWNNFVWSLVVTTGDKVKPVILAITTLQGSIDAGDGVKLAGYVIASLPLIILFVIATKPFIDGVTAGAVKG